LLWLTQLSEHLLLVMDEMGRPSFRIMRFAVLSIQPQALGRFSYKSCIHFISTALCKIEIFGWKLSKWAGPPLMLWVIQRGQKLICDRTWNISKCLNFNRLVHFLCALLSYFIAIR
jgi:hypothetical protein